MCDMTHPCVPWLIHTCDETHSYVWHDSIIMMLVKKEGRDWMCMNETVCNDSFIHIQCHTYARVLQMSISTKCLRFIHMCDNECVWMSRDTERVIWIMKQMLKNIRRMCAMTDSYVCHDSLICVTWLTHMCAMTHSYVCHDSLIRVTQLIHRMRRDSFIGVTRLNFFLCVSNTLICVSNTLIRMTERPTRLILVLDSTPIRVTWPNRTRAMTHSYVCHDSSIRVTWLIHTCDITLAHVWHDLFTQLIKESSQSQLEAMEGNEPVSTITTSWTSQCTTMTIILIEVHSRSR